ncbi:MAG: CDP-glycerol glycerophosphotransferase (TagB/SpsB family) [Francisellaceae bacterium]
MKTFLKIGTYLFRFTAVCLVSLIPKNKSIWVFGAWFGKSFTDNPKYMYQYLASVHSNEITPIWIAKDNKLVKELKKQGVNAYYHNSVAGIYYQIVAKFAFVGHSITSDLNPLFIGFNTKRIQLWHGVPLKKIGFDDHIFTNKRGFFQKKPTISALLTNNSYDIVTSTGNKCSKIFSSAFNLPLEKCLITGFPRNDVFLEKKLKRPYKYQVIYMPTFRGGIGTEFDLFKSFGFDSKDVEKKLAAENIELHIRTHPANKPSSFILKAIENSDYIQISTISDIYECINSYDCLITDYSSIMFDFVISGKPIILAPFDIDSYLKVDRELYYNYEDIAEQKKCLNWDEVINEIISFKNAKRIYCNEFLKSHHDCTYTEKYAFSANVFKAVIKYL